MIHCYEISDRPGETLELGYRSVEEDYPSIIFARRLPTGGDMVTRVGYLRGQEEMDYLAAFLDGFADQINKAVEPKFTISDIRAIERVARIFESLVDRAIEGFVPAELAATAKARALASRDIRHLRTIAAKIKETLPKKPRRPRSDDPNSN